MQITRTQRFCKAVGVPVLSKGTCSVKIHDFHPVHVHVHAPIDTEVGMSIFRISLCIHAAALHHNSMRRCRS
jgi:hypothetical protein